MVAFWDTSALVPLLMPEEASARVLELRAADPSLTVWWAAGVECTSAIARNLRNGTLAQEAASVSFQRLAELEASWIEVEPGSDLRANARRILRVHDLRAADALQLAAAFAAAEGRPPTLEFVCLDTRLADVARREGFVVVTG